MSFSYTVQQLKIDLAASLHGTTLNKVQSINSLIQRASSDLLLEVDPQETIRIQQLASPIFNSVYDYTLPVDLKGTKVIDIRPQANRTLADRYVQEYNQAFDMGKSLVNNPNLTIQFNQGIKTIRIENNLIINGILLNQADSVTGNGTWVGSNGASNIRQDNLQFVNGASSSVEFDADALSLTPTMTNSTMTALDLTDHYLQSQIFFWVYMPVASRVTSVQIRWGSDTSNYWYKNITLTQSGTAFANGWNLLQADWATASTNGTPNYTAVNTLATVLTVNGTATVGYRINGFYSRLGIISEIEYYSKYIYQDAITGAFQETITDDSNIINLDTESRNLLFLKVGEYAVQQVQGMDALYFDANHFAQRYARDVALYKAQYKSQWQKPRSQYYQMPNPSNNNRMGWNRYNY